MKRYKVLRYGSVTLRSMIALTLVLAIVVGAPCVFSRFQIIPAIAACATVYLLFWLIATLLFGRIYCSTVCPFGSMIDFIARISRSRKSHYSYAPPSTRLRITIFVAIVVCAIFGLSAVVALFEPYSAFARIVTAFARPTAVGFSALIVAGLTLLATAIISNRRGRLICHTVCPIGTALGSLSKLSVFHADINTDLCTNCGRCSDICSSECIDLIDHVVDSSRCVVCFDCMDVCPNDAMQYRRGRHQLSIPMMQRIAGSPSISALKSETSDNPAVVPFDRRSFFIAAAAASVAAGRSYAANIAPDFVAGSQPLVPLNHVTPPGAVSRQNYLDKCTACGACIAACPTKVLISSSNEYGIRHALTPVMDFDRAFCKFNCTRCTEVCPSGAIAPLTTFEKHSATIGRARILASNCILFENDTPCDDCAKACPKRAISFCSDNDDRRYPRVEISLCIGCGHCQYVCPALPYKAIVIEGS